MRKAFLIIGISSTRTEKSALSGSGFLFFFSLGFDLEAFKKTDSFIPTTIIAFAEDKYQYFFG